ncbi:hypothetical protein DYB37_012799, partial [Aphanomyces astaci]
IVKNLDHMDDIPATTFLVAGRPSAVSAVTDGLKIVVPSKPLLNTLLKWDDVLGANNSQNPTTVTVHTLGKASNGKRYANIVALVATKNDGQQEVERWVQIITFFADPTRAKATVLPCVKLFQKVEALFAHANIHVTKVLTERAAHATELATAIDHTQYDALVIVGGDGVIYEGGPINPPSCVLQSNTLIVVQGLMQRPDWADVIQIPLAILPAGGGNGLAKSLTESSGEVYSFENCAYLAIKGQPQPLDLATLRSKTATKFIFLSLSWAFLAEMDFESEKYRFAGAQRFTISALGKILSGKNWSGSFSYVEPTADEVVPTYWADGHDDGRAAPKLTLLPPSAEDPKPETWKTIEGNFSLFWAMNAAWAGTNGLVAPSAEFDDGYMHVVIMPGKVSMAEYMGVFLTLDSGRHVDKPTVQVIKTRYTHR